MSNPDHQQNYREIYDQVRSAVDADNPDEAVQRIAGLDSERDRLRALLALARDLAHELGALQQLGHLGTRTLGRSRDRDLELAYGLAYSLELALDLDLQIAIAAARALELALARDLPERLTTFNRVIMRILPDLIESKT